MRVEIEYDCYTGSPDATAAGAADADAADPVTGAAGPSAGAAARAGAALSRAAPAGPRTGAEPAAAGSRARAAATARGDLRRRSGRPEPASVLGVPPGRPGESQACAAYDGARRAGQHRFEVQPRHLGQVVGES